MTVSSRPTVAEHLLEALRKRGIDTLHVNAGTDFAPIVDAYARGGASYPEPVILAHENLALGMAHGACLVSGTPQAAMFHVSVGTANAICAVMNAARDNVPLVVMAGRTPILEGGALGARDADIHWAQEMFDQGGMLRELVKWDYELRDPRQVDVVLDRAINIASTPPSGPVYLSLPREILAEAAITNQESLALQTAAPAPDPLTVGRVAERIAAARLPVIVTATAGADVRVVERLGALCERFHIGIVEPSPRRVNVPYNHPFHLGDGQDAIREADVVLVLECDVPWIECVASPAPEAFVVHAGPDPLFARYPVRSHRADVALITNAFNLVESLAVHLHGRALNPGRLSNLLSSAQSASSRIANGRDGRMTKQSISEILGDVLDESALVFNEYWADPRLLRRRLPGTYFALSPAGGLGWALPAALGARRAAPQRTAVATVGDGAYLFANPAACHHASRKYDLPVITVIANNGRWRAVEEATMGVYPNNAGAATEDRLSGLAPLPAFEKYVEASGGYGERVVHEVELRPALERALHAVSVEGRQALLDVACA